jgi:hypothetical protein
VQQVLFTNRGRSITLEAAPRRVKVDGTVRLRVMGPEIEGAVVFTMGRVIGRTAGSESSIDVPAETLGRGPVTIRATGRTAAGRESSVNAVPVTIEVE